MPGSGVDGAKENPLEDLVGTVSDQAIGLVRQQMEVARRELTTKAGQAGPGISMLGGAAVFGALASGTGTAGLVLLLARRPGASAAALGVAGAYAGAGALLARQGLARIREAGPIAPENAGEKLGSAKRTARKPARKAAPRSRKSATSQRRTPHAQAKRKRPPAS